MARPPLLLLLLLMLAALLAMALVVTHRQGEEDRNKAAAETTTAVGRRKATGDPIFPVFCVVVGGKGWGGEFSSVELVLLDRRPWLRHKRIGNGTGREVVRIS